jgi:hypothetical protein
VVSLVFQAFFEHNKNHIVVKRYLIDLPVFARAETEGIAGPSHETEIIDTVQPVAAEWQ